MKQAVALSEQDDKSLTLSQLYGQLSDVYLLQNQWRLSSEYAEKAVAQAQKTGNARDHSAALNYLGNAFFVQGELARALSAYKESLNLPVSDAPPQYRVDVLLNAAKSYLALEDDQGAKQAAIEAIELLRRIPDSEDKMIALTAAGYVLQQLIDENTAVDSDSMKTAVKVFEEVVALSSRLKSPLGLSYGNGHLGELFRLSRQFDLSEKMFNRALFFAELSQRSELIARWHWRLAGLKRGEGDITEAKIHFEKALEYLQTLRSSAFYRLAGRGENDWQQSLFGDFIDVLLREASETHNIERRNRLLQRIIELVESNNAVELTNYFQDECVEALRKKIAALTKKERIQAGTAVLYTIIFPDRLILLLNETGGKVRHAVVPVAETRLNNVATKFRNYLSRYGNPRKILQQGQILYDWIIRPFAHELVEAKIDTLVVVPSGILRTIPFAALYHDDHFLIDDYALALSPGLELTTPKSSGQFAAHDKILLNGLSLARAGFLPLPHVEAELNRIQPLYASTLLVNEDFNYLDVRQSLLNDNYSSVVFATHSRFNKNFRQSFLLSFDKKIYLNDLESLISLNRFHDPSIDLLVLSACETAAGDEKAALGMAGAAVKAGAGSVLASLWVANDASTSILVPEFFNHMKTEGLSKAKALQRAQQAILASAQFRHPFHWAGFLLIGNWL
ncbi:MAG: CHAT domain-containing protein [Gammaproteobacteria bacterium]